MDTSILIPVCIPVLSIEHLIDLLSQGYCVKTPMDVYLVSVNGSLYDFDSAKPVFTKLYSIYTDLNVCIAELSVNANVKTCRVYDIGYKHVASLNVVVSLSNAQLTDLVKDLTDKGKVRVDNQGYVDAKDCGLINNEGDPFDDSVLITMRAELEYRKKNSIGLINLHLLAFTNGEISQLRYYLVKDGKISLDTKLHTKCMYYNLVTPEGYPVSEYLIPMIISYIVNGGSLIINAIWTENPVSIDIACQIPKIYEFPVVDDNRPVVLDSVAVSKRFTLEPITLYTYNEMLDAFDAGYIIRTLDNGFYVKERGAVYSITSKDICSEDRPVSFNDFDTIFKATMDFQTLTVYRRAWGILNICSYQITAGQIVNITDPQKRQILINFLTFNTPPDDAYIAQQIKLMATYIATLCTPAGRNDRDYNCNRVIITDMVPLFAIAPLVSALAEFKIKAVYIYDLNNMNEGWPYIVPVT